MQKRDEKGRFIRTRQIWTPANWNDGYIDNRGRFRVYRPDYPRAYKTGYYPRSYIVFWLHYGRPHIGELHHINGDVSDDRIENLKEMTNSEHQKHHKERPVEIMCDHCGKSFIVPMWRIRERKIRFCSQNCYHNHPRSDTHKRAISKGVKRAHKERRS